MAKQEKTAAELYREERKARIAKAAKKNAKKSHKIVLTKGNKIAISVVLVLALVAGIGAFAINNSGVLERGKTAFYIGDIEVKAPEYSYYYNSIFSNYFNYSYQYSMYGMQFPYDYKVAPDVQPYKEGEIEGVENPMYTDFFAQTAKDSLKYVKASVLYAQENGIELDEADLASVDASIEELTTTAANSNTPVSVYLRTYYGKGMSLDLLRKISEEQTLATKVQTVKTEEFASKYTDEKVEEIYNKDLTAYGVVTLRLYEVVADTIEKPAEKDGDPPTITVTKEAMAAAKAKAESFVSKVTDEASFKATAAEFEKAAKNDKWEEMKTDDTKTLLKDMPYNTIQSRSTDKDFLKWAFAKDTAVGSTFITENEESGYSVFMMVDPVHKLPDEVASYDVRHILIQFPEEEEGEDKKEDEKKEDVEVELLDASKYDVTVDIDVDLEKTGDKALYKEAQTILEDYLAGDKTEESFAELAKKYSADGNAAQGGIYEDVTLGRMVSEFEGWAIEDGRKYGDVGIVETEYGYHIMYFIDTEVTTWDSVIRNEKGAEDFSEFSIELENADNVKISGIVESAMTDTENFVVNLAKQQIRAAQQNAQSAY